MTVPFSEINKNTGEPTYFIEKVWQFIERNEIVPLYLTQKVGYADAYYEKFDKFWDEYHNDNLASKLHTIRRDEKGSYKPGKLIHPFINSRQPGMFQFAPAFPIVSTQKIDISYINRGYTMVILIDGEYFYDSELGRGKDEMLQLALNDGFESIESFFNWFSEDFTGVVVHFTDLRY